MFKMKEVEDNLSIKDLKLNIVVWLISDQRGTIELNY
jgi:hypothetical protein